MDLLTAVVTLVGPAVGKMIQDVWQDYRTGRQTRLGIAVNSQGFQTEIPNVLGVLSIPNSNFVEEEAPILLTGEFIGEESFVEFAHIFLEEEEKRVVVLVIDQEAEDVYFFEFGFDGYAIGLWPGYYSFYALIVDPILDDVLGFGYPLSEELNDPNPVVVRGEGSLEIDFILFDADEIE